ncbi:hypothetical protein Dsin_013683 [Dipteronia sinensis]|uniref:Reverse transcriptase zinc-binding domain-containing protein n=1 Tax=Dipteronia sinensis TaxID=43782 RepID=A0AAE0E941_9ROSI|nr:hypothetical protein Dsin_013683 [Dipteronia sinensis]
MVNLAKRGKLVDNVCLICNKQMESTMHALWRCPSLKRVRVFIKGVRADDHIQFFDFIFSCTSRLLANELELLCLVFWRVLFRRNGKVHNSAAIDDKNVVPWASSFLLDFQQANGPKEVDSKVGSDGVRIVQDRPSWCPPSVDSYKINTDAAIDVANGNVGIGIIIRDHRGQVMASSARMDTTPRLWK